MRRQLGKHVRLAGSFRTQFHQVVVAFTKCDQACQLIEFFATAEGFGVQADTLHQHIDPFVGAEMSASFHVLVKVE